MEDDQNEADKDDFAKRLQAARTEFQKMEEQTGRAAPSDKTDEGAIRSGRAGSELLGSIFAGALLGFLIDKVLPTAPWGLIGMMVLGMVSGVLRANAAMQKNNKNNS
ncbi:MAG: AtpZ/AtpI family protein [Alphaproteobacteria bacterium]|nr:AtpZ/AtpI family protein [Alphaproteobacteria bacterium]MCB9974620.1 AtpZ/AtpI family protein [Rhodospirillales bacterium]